MLKKMVVSVLLSLCLFSLGVAPNGVALNKKAQKKIRALVNSLKNDWNEDYKYIRIPFREKLARWWPHGGAGYKRTPIITFGINTNNQRW